jgi:hypothetical protein
MAATIAGSAVKLISMRLSITPFMVGIRMIKLVVITCSYPTPPQQRRVVRRSLQNLLIAQ